MLFIRCYWFLERTQTISAPSDANFQGQGVYMTIPIVTFHPQVGPLECTLNQNDTWHVAKSVEREINRVGKGPKRQHTQTWHEEISDKVHSVRVHVQYAIRNCYDDPDFLRQKLDNVVEHYKNFHGNCSEESRCRQDPNYKPSKLLIRDPRAEELLRTAIRKTVVYVSGGLCARYGHILC